MAIDTLVLAGWATVEFTPDIPCRMGGYGARTEPAQAIHDPLYATALALGTKQEPFALIVCDCLDIHEEITQAVRRNIAENIPGATVWLSATHTHSGPLISQASSLSSETSNTAAAERLMAGASKAALEAVANMHVTQARWASGSCDGIASNRDHPDKAADIALDLLCFYEANEPVAIFGSFPCHPTVMSAANLLISADLPGAFRRQLIAMFQARQYRVPTVALATGAAGDISTRHTRRGQGFEELERLGNLLAEQACALVDKAQPIHLEHPAIQEMNVRVETKTALSAGELAAYTSKIEASMQAARQAGNMGEARTLETALQGLKVAQMRATMADEGQQEREVGVQVAVASLGELAFAAVPGEIYNQIGSEVRQTAGKPLLFMGYTNGYVGYIPTREAYSEMDYEVLMSPFAPGTAERVGDALRMMLSQKEKG
jgi:neutral ceramidase